MNQFLRIILITAIATAIIPAAVTPDTVVATVNGKEITAREVDQILAGAPLEMQERLNKDRRQFIEQYGLVMRLANEAEETGLGNKSPYKEKLEWNRMQILWQAAVAEKSKELKAGGATAEAHESELRQWMDSVKNQSEAEYVNQDYFGSAEQAANVPPKTVVAKINGDPVTAGEIAHMLRGTTARVQENFRKDRRAFLQDYAMMNSMVKIAEKAGYAAKSPYKDQLAWVRQNVLMQARLDDYSNSIIIRRSDEKEYYDAHLDKYTQADVKVLYVPFGSGETAKAADRKVLTEVEAKTRIEEVRTKIENGADFVEMVREYSEDATSKAKDGDFGTIRRSDKIPDHIKDAIFKLAEGEVSQPVRQPNGFYLFKVTNKKVQTLEEVRQKLIPEAQSARFGEWFDKVRSEITVEIKNEEYFSAGASQ